MKIVFSLCENATLCSNNCNKESEVKHKTKGHNQLPTLVYSLKQNTNRHFIFRDTRNTYEYSLECNKWFLWMSIWDYSNKQYIKVKKFRNHSVINSVSRTLPSKRPDVSLVSSTISFLQIRMNICRGIVQLEDKVP